MGVAINPGDICRLESHNPEIMPELVVVLSMWPGWSLVVIIDCDADMATERDVLVPIPSDGYSWAAGQEWVWAVWPDTAATVRLERLTPITWHSPIYVPGEVCEYVQDVAEGDVGAWEAPPRGCRRGLIRTVPGDVLWRRRADRVRRFVGLVTEGDWWDE